MRPSGAVMETSLHASPISSRVFLAPSHWPSDRPPLREDCDIVRSHAIPRRRHHLAAVNVNRSLRVAKSRPHRLLEIFPASRWMATYELALLPGFHRRGHACCLRDPSVSRLRRPCGFTAPGGRLWLSVRRPGLRHARIVSATCDWPHIRDTPQYAQIASLAGFGVALLCLIAWRFAALTPIPTSLVIRRTSR
jgi:hypothetical protein